MPDIYDQHRAAFANVSAYIVMKNGERIASVAFKYPRNGAGRLYAYVHVFGTEMVRGFAGGYGYDKHSAAVEDAIRKAGSTEPGHLRSAWLDTVDAIRSAILDTNAGGQYWDRRLRDAGYDVWQAV